MTSLEAYRSAREQGPSDITRNITSREPGWSFWYAVVVDRALHATVVKVLPSIKQAVAQEQFDFD